VQVYPKEGVHKIVSVSTMRLSASYDDLHRILLLHAAVGGLVLRNASKQSQHCLALLHSSRRLSATRCRHRALLYAAY